MPEPDPNASIVAAPVSAPAKVIGGKSKVVAPLEPFTCDWAKDGLAKALEGMKSSSEGVLEYHIGSRGLKREASKEQIANVDYWNKMVQLYCDEPGLPTSITGRDTACRIVPRDL